MNLILEDGIQPKETSSAAKDFAKKLVDNEIMTDVAAAALAGNIEQESRFVPDRIQIGYGGEKDQGTLKDSGKGGYSWAQWTQPDRKEDFRKFVQKKFGVDLNNKNATYIHAYDYLLHDLKSGKDKGLHYLDFDKFQKEKDIITATNDIVDKYEIAGNKKSNTRIAYAKDILNYLRGVKTTSTKKPELNVHTVVAGDTLSGIAVKYKTTIDNIKKLNKLTSDTIKIGQKLKYK